MSLDHGTLNVPLAKRGDIDKQIDKHKRESQRVTIRQFRANQKRHRELVYEAKILVAMVSDARMAELGKPYGMTVKQTRKEFASIASVNPAMVAQAMRKELGKCA